MRKLIEGLHQFKKEVFVEQKEVFERLTHGQRPEALFITCSDSRINPNELTQTGPGELFILRNAGNIVPPYGTVSGEAATIEFALEQLEVRDIILCGHSFCGAVAGMMHPETLIKMPAVADWLGHGQRVRYIVKENYPNVDDEEEIKNIAVQENVLVQLENLRTHPSVASRLADGRLNIYGWVYKFETGEVFSYRPVSEQFKLITAHPGKTTGDMRISAQFNI